MPGSNRGVVLAAWSCAAALAAGGAAHGPRADEPAAAARLVLRDGAAQRGLEGRVVIEAVDGGLLVEQADQRYEVVQPGAVVERRPLPAPPPTTPEELGRRILAELPAGFAVHRTRHYVVCFNTSRDYAKWAAGLFERLHEAFLNAWSHAGLAVHEPTQPLVVVIFADRRDYEAFADRDIGSAADRVVGYYNLLTNRVMTYDLTATDAAGWRPPGGRRGLDVLAQPESALLVSTLVHEATHQMAFNCGMHRRLAPVPLWVSEGIATYFETPDLRNRDGWRGLGVVNRTRLKGFRAAHRPGDIAAVVSADDRFRDADTAVAAYATAWALTWFLVETRKEQFVAYLATLADRQPLTEYPAADRIADFVAAFGIAPNELEAPLERHMARVESRRP
jgi:hypothetical protein